MKLTEIIFSNFTNRIHVCLTANIFEVRDSRSNIGPPCMDTWNDKSRYRFTSELFHTIESYTDFCRERNSSMLISRRVQTSQWAIDHPLLYLGNTNRHIDRWWIHDETAKPRSVPLLLLLILPINLSASGSRPQTRGRTQQAHRNITIKQSWHINNTSRCSGD